MEALAAIGLVATCRTKPVMWAARFAWSKFKGPQFQTIPDFQKPQNLIKFNPRAMFAMSSYVARAKEVTIQNRAKFALVLQNFKNRLKTPVIVTTESSQATTQSVFSNVFKPYGPLRSSASSQATGATSYQFNQLNATQHNYGLIHWYGRQIGKSDEWINEFGKKRFWQGCAAGIFGTAWIMKPADENKQKERIDKKA